MKKFSFLFLAATLAFTGCGKKPEEEKAAPAPAEPAPAPTPAPEVKPTEPAPTTPPVAAADSITIYGTHTEPSPKDPIEVKVNNFKIVKADFDPAKVEGGTAELELDLTSISTDDPKRTDHLKSPDFIDAAKYSLVNVKIDNVKKTADNKYSADATVKFHDSEKKYPVAFDVTETTPEGVRINLEHKFTRTEWKVGKESPDPKVAPVAAGLTLKANLFIKKA